MFKNSRLENPQKMTQLNSRSHPRHLVGKGQHKKTPLYTLLAKLVLILSWRLQPLNKKIEKRLFNVRDASNKQPGQ